MKVLYLTICFLILQSYTSIAQDSTVLSADQKVAKPLSVSEITVQYKKDYLYLDRLTESIPSDEQITKATKEFSPKIKKLGQELERVEQSVEIADNTSMLKRCISRANTLEKKLNTGTTRLIANNEKYYEDVQNLEKMANVWELTKNNLSKETTSSSFLKQIDKLYREIESTKTILNKRRLNVMNITSDFTDMSLRISRVKEKATSKKEILEHNISSKTQKDITNIKFSLLSKDQLQNTEDQIDNFASEMVSFVNNWSNEIFIWFVTCALTVGLIIPSVLKKRKIPNSESNEMLIRHPIASLMLVVIAFIFIILKDMPSTLKDLVIVWALIIIVYLMHKHISGQLYKTLVLRSFLLIPLFICINISQEYAIARLSMVLVILAEPYMLYIIVKVLNKSETINRKVRNASIFISIVFGIMSIVALISAILGYVMLAERLMYAIYKSVYLAFALYILCQISKVYIISFLESQVGSKINVFALNKEAIISKAQTIIKVIALIIWSITFLSEIGIYNNVHDLLISILDKGFNIGDVHISIRMTIGFTLTIYLAIVISSLIQQILAEDILSHTKISSGVSYTISILVRYFLLTIGFLIALRLVGIKFSDMAIIISAFGVGIGFGLQSIFSNLVSGLILLFERPIEKGDTIEVGTLIGTVTDIGIRSSKIHTVDGAEVIVPNSNLITNEVVNWTLSDRKRRIEILVGVSYNSDPHQVKDLMMGVLENANNILRYPEPLILFHEMADSSLNFRLLFWTDKYEEWVKIKSEVTFAVFDILGEHNIEIPFPQQDLHIRSGLEALGSKLENKG